MAEDEKHFPEGVEPELEPNPEKVEASSITFEGKEISGHGDLLTELTGLTLEKLKGAEDTTPGEQTPEEDEAARRRMEALREAAAAIEEFKESGEEGDLRLGLDESGRLVGLPPPEEEEVKPQPVPGDVEGGKVPVPGENPPDSGGDNAAPEPDPMVVGSVVETECWKTLDSSIDPVSAFADKLQEALLNGDFESADIPHPPNYNGGDFVAGYDKKEELVLYYLVTVDGDFQKSLGKLRDKIGLFTISIEHMGILKREGVLTTLDILVVPIYKGAEGCSDLCAGYCEDPFVEDPASAGGEPNPSVDFSEAETEAACDGLGGSWIFKDPLDLSNFDPEYGATSDTSTGWNLDKENGDSPSYPDNCGFKMMVVEQVYVSVGGSIGMWLREVTVDKCGAITNVTARLTTGEYGAEIKTQGLDFEAGWYDICGECDYSDTFAVIDHSHDYSEDFAASDHSHD